MNENKGKSRNKLRKTIKKLKHRVSELESGNESRRTSGNKLFLDFSHILKLVAREFKKDNHLNPKKQLNYYSALTPKTVKITPITVNTIAPIK